MPKDQEQPRPPPKRSDKPKHRPWHPVKYEKADAAAIEAVANGKATPEQQARAMDFIVVNLCGTYEMTYIPDSDRDSVFADGKRFVGQQLVSLINKLNILRRAEGGEQG